MWSYVRKLFDIKIGDIIETFEEIQTEESSKINKMSNHMSSQRQMRFMN